MPTQQEPVKQGEPSAEAAQTAYAIVEFGGKSVRVEPGKSVVVDTRVGEFGVYGEKGKEIILDKVLLVRSAEGVVRVGAPTVSGVTVKAVVAGEEKGPKLIVFHKRRRKGFMKKQGHRQKLTRLNIESIAG